MNDKWAAAIAERISDEWNGKEQFPEAAELLRDSLETMLKANPEICQSMIGTGIIEEDALS
jgi:hypothetical protein